jgi:hypothetical protein
MSLLVDTTHQNSADPLFISNIVDSYYTTLLKLNIHDHNMAFEFSKDKLDDYFSKIELKRKMIQDPKLAREILHQFLLKIAFNLEKMRNDAFWFFFYDRLKSLIYLDFWIKYHLLSDNEAMEERNQHNEEETPIFVPLISNFLEIIKNKQLALVKEVPNINRGEDTSGQMMTRKATIIKQPILNQYKETLEKLKSKDISKNGSSKFYFEYDRQLIKKS